MSIARPWPWGWRWRGDKERGRDAGTSGDRPGGTGADAGGNAGSTAEVGSTGDAAGGVQDDSDAMTRARFGGGGDPTEYVTVYVAQSVEEAYILKGRLESEGIPVLVKINPMRGLYPIAIHGTEVQVPSPLLQKARQVLDL